MSPFISPLKQWRASDALPHRCFCLQLCVLAVPPRHTQCPWLFVTATRCCTVRRHQRLLNRFPVNGSDVAEKPLACHTVLQHTAFTRIFSYLPAYLRTNSLKNDPDRIKACVILLAIAKFPCTEVVPFYIPTSSVRKTSVSPGIHQ